MKTYKNLYSELCSYKNLELAFKKARKNKTFMPYVKRFEKDLKSNILQLKEELENFTYKPLKLKKFIIRDPKTRTIHSSKFRDRIVHHAIVNILEPIYEKIFIYDSFASRKDKGTHKAILRFDKFKRKVSKNGRLIKNHYDNNSIQGYCFKADIRHYFDTVDHNTLINILKRKIKDENTLILIKIILNNFNQKIKNKGMPLGNLTSQFFANVYLNDLDYLIKHKLKIKYYIRYVDDFVILHPSKQKLKLYKIAINYFIKQKLKLELHPDKSKIFLLSKGVSLLGYRIFYYPKLLRKSNIRDFKKKVKIYKEEKIEKEEFIRKISGWIGYATWANTYKLRKNLNETLIFLQL